MPNTVARVHAWKFTAHPRGSEDPSHEGVSSAVQPASLRHTRHSPTAGASGSCSRGSQDHGSESLPGHGTEFIGVVLLVVANPHPRIHVCVLEGESRAEACLGGGFMGAGGPRDLSSWDGAWGPGPGGAQPLPAASQPAGRPAGASGPSRP